MERLDDARIRALHEKFGKAGAVCWWASVPLLFVHFVICCLDTNWDLSVYGDMLIQSPVVFKLLMCSRWMARMLLFVAFGWGIVRERLRLLTAVAAVGMGLTLALQLVGPASSVGLWDAAAWIVAYLWMVAVMFLRKGDRRRRNLVLLCLFIPGAVKLFSVYYLFRFIGTEGTAWPILVSLLLQDALRIAGMILLLLWLFTLKAGGEGGRDRGQAQKGRALP